MPWHIGKHADCDKEFAVIKDADDSLAGCHDTEAEAKKHLAALYANDEKADDDGDEIVKNAEVQHKSFDLIDVKADPGTGEVVALASVFGSVDLVGDKMIPGAFTKTLQQWRDKNKPIPIIVHHKWDDPMSLIGGANPNDVVETSQGLMVKGRLHIDRNPVAAQVHHLMNEQLLTGWSFGYRTLRQKSVDGVNEVKEVELVEVGPTLKGAHPEAQLQAVKGLEPPVKAEMVRNAITGDEGMSDQQITDATRRGELEQALGRSIEDVPSSAKTDTDFSDGTVTVAKGMLLEVHSDVNFTPRQMEKLKVQSVEIEDRSEEPRVERSQVDRQDPLRDQTSAIALELTLGRSPKAVPDIAKPDQPKQEPEPLDERDLRRKTDRAALDIALGGSDR